MQPILMAVDDEADALEMMERELRKRYGETYPPSVRPFDHTRQGDLKVLAHSIPRHPAARSMALSIGIGAYG